MSVYDDDDDDDTVIYNHRKEMYFSEPNIFFVQLSSIIQIILVKIITIVFR